LYNTYIFTNKNFNIKKRNLGGGRVVGEVAQTMYTHVSKCKNSKIKGERENKKETWASGVGQVVRVREALSSNPSSGGQKSKVEVLIPSRGSEGESVPKVSPAAGGGWHSVSDGNNTPHIFG
jgi:hypothetical protein